MDQTQPEIAAHVTTLGKMLHTLGNLLLLAGLYLLLFVGGLFADEQYNVYAASGANDERAPVVAAGRIDEDISAVATPQPRSLLLTRRPPRRVDPQRKPACRGRSASLSRTRAQRAS